MCHDDYAPLGAIVFSPWQAKVHMHGVDLTKFDGGGARDVEVLPSIPLVRAISGRSRILAPLDHRCCNVCPLSSVYGHPYCPHGSSGPI